MEARIPALSCHYPGRNPPEIVVRRPSCPNRNATEKQSTKQNAKAAEWTPGGKDRADDGGTDALHQEGQRHRLRRVHQ
jgi:hypothetical protein